MVRYYGWYSNRMRGDRQRAEQLQGELDPLLCSHCGGLMKIVSFIYEHRVIKKILAHLGLLLGEEQKRGPPALPKKCSEIVAEPFDDGWPEYEEIVIDVQA
jgi:hypothetical protein